MTEGNLSPAQIEERWLTIARRADELIQASSEGVHPVREGSSLSGDNRRSTPFQVSHAVDLNIMAAVDHLHALCTLVLRTGILHAAAPGTLARGVLETSSTGLWILSPADRDERISRTLRWHVPNVRDGDAAGTGAGLKMPTSKTDRLARIDAVAQSRGLDQKLIRGGYKSIEAVLAAEAHVGGSIGVVLPWRIASGLAHGRPWAYVGFLELEEHVSADPTVVHARATSDMRRMLYLAWAGEKNLNALIKLREQQALSPF